MQAFLSISIWITLAMVLPGLVTMAVIFGALAAAGELAQISALNTAAGLSEWLVAGVAVTSMIMTQALGILLEKLLVGLSWLGPRKIPVAIPRGVDPLGQLRFELQPYEEYRGLYLLLSELRADEDSHGHLQRALAQFFLSNNVTVSLLIGIVVALYELIAIDARHVASATGYLLLLTMFLVVTAAVARIRFEVMTKALWAARRRRLEDESNDAAKLHGSPPNSCV